jgi:hypothetical protein
LPPTQPASALAGDTKAEASRINKMPKYVSLISLSILLMAIAYIYRQIAFFGWVTICGLDF